MTTDRRGSLRLKWTAAMLAVALVPLALVAFLVVRIQRTGLTEAETELELSIGDQAAHDIAVALDDAERATHRAAAILASDRITDEDARLMLARDAVASSDLIDWVSVFARDGAFIGSIEKGTGHAGTDLPVGSRPAVGQWIRGPAGTEPRFAEPLMADGAVTGYLLAAARVDRLEALVVDLSTARFGRKDRVVVVDDERRVVVGAESFGPRGSVVEGHGVVGDVDVGAFSRSFVVTRGWVAGDGVPMIGTLRTLPARRWAVVVQRPEEEAFRALGGARRAFSWAALGIALVAILVGSLVARRTTRPVAELVALTKAYARREFDRKSTVRSNDELDQLGDALGTMADDLASSEAEVKRRAAVEAGLARYMPAEVAAAVASGAGSLALGGRRKQVTVIFADIASFTPFAERSSPEDAVVLLNEVFTVLSEVVFRHRGMVDKFIGDCIMAVYGVRDDEPDDHVERALASAEDMQRFVAAVAPSWRERFAIDVTLGIGISTGEALVGNLGSDRRMEFTAIGDSVNVAARLETLARPGQILTTGRVAERASSGFVLRSLGAHSLRGKAEPLEVFEVAL